MDDSMNTQVAQQPMMPPVTPPADPLAQPLTEPVAPVAPPAPVAPVGPVNTDPLSQPVVPPVQPPAPAPVAPTPAAPTVDDLQKITQDLQNLAQEVAQTAPAAAQPAAQPVASVAPAPTQAPEVKLTDKKYKITVYTITECQYCKAEKDYLKSKGLEFTEKNVETSEEFLKEMLGVGENFAGVPVTVLEGPSGEKMVVKGFTQNDFEGEMKKVGFN